MDPAACRVIYIDDRFNTERWISRDGLTPSSPQRAQSHTEFSELPPDLQANVNAFLSVFNQVYVCHSGRSFSSKLSELHDQVKSDCTPILACFDVGIEGRHDFRHDHYFRPRSRNAPPTSADSPLPSPTALRREITFSSESDESYGLQLLSRICSDLQVDEGVKLIIPVAIVQPKRKDSYDQAFEHNQPVSRAPYGSEQLPAQLQDESDIVDPYTMLQCLDAGALDVVKSPLDKAAIMGLTVHAYRIYKSAKKEQSAFMALRRGRKQSWVGVEEEKPYAYLREAMVKKLLKGICEPQNVIEDYQHRDLVVESSRKKIIAEEVGKWSFCGHDFTEDELVYAGYCMLNHALQLSELETWHMPETDLLHFMQGCRVAYNSFVLYHNFRHAVDVLQSLFYFLIQIGVLPPYPEGSSPPPLSQDKSPVAKLLGPFEALTLLISAIGHDVGHPGVNNMFLVKLNAPLAQLYNDQSVLEAFHCAAYSQILRRHWPAAFNDKAVRKLMISSILATDMGVHSDYMQQLGNLQEKIHESKVTDGWSPKDVDAFRVLTCGLLIKCADISNVARPWSVAEKWTNLLQKEFAHQGEMEQAVGMETTLFGGPPELGNMLKLANGQIGFMTIFAHPLFSNVTDIIPAMGFAADEILTNKGVWFTRAEHEKKKQIVKKGTGFGDGGSVSPRTQSPVGLGRKPHPDSGKAAPNLLPSSPLRMAAESPKGSVSRDSVSDISGLKAGSTTPRSGSRTSSLAAVAGVAVQGNGQAYRSTSPAGQEDSKDRRRSSVTVTQSTTAKENEANRGISPSGTPASHDSDASDSRRDNAVSMRAGSEALPIPADSNPERHVNHDPEALSKFTFATSDVNEPVRTYDPSQHYPPVHASARASVPVPNIEQQQHKTDLENGTRQITPTQSDTTSANVQGIGEGQFLTPSHSTEATSYTSEKSHEISQQKSDFETRRARAASAPMSSPTAGVRPSFSIGGKKSASRESSKNDIRTTILSNGEVEESNSQDKKRTLPRRRSRIKLGLAFWRKKSDKSVAEEDSAAGDDPSEQSQTT